MWHFTSFFLKFKSNLLVKSVFFLLNAAFAMAILDLILHVYLVKGYCTYNVCFDFLCKLCLKHFSFEEEFSKILFKMCIGLQVKGRLFFSDFNET